MIQINDTLTKSRNPSEHGYKLEGQKGEVIQVVGDGFNRIKFNQFFLRKQVKINRRVRWMLVPLEWYVHDDDLKIL